MGEISHVAPVATHWSHQIAFSSEPKYARTKNLSNFSLTSAGSVGAEAKASEWQKRHRDTEKENQQNLTKKRSR